MLLFLNEYGAWLLAFAVVFLSYVWKRRKEEDPFAIAACPNPNCIRCRRYAAVNTRAQERFASMKDKPERLVQALKYGRRGQGLRRKDGISPAVGQYPTVLLIPDLAARPVVTDMHLQSCKILKQHANTILQEYLEANQYANWLENDVQVQNDSSKWNVLHIMNQGVVNEENAALCPETTKVVQSLSLDVMTDCIFGNIFLSVLTPGTSIEPHCGPTNARHRLHLALLIPSHEEPVLTVLEKQITWKEGQAFVFDDSLMHAVDYPDIRTTAVSAKLRVVLIVDLWHPELTPLERKAIQQLYPTAE